MTLSLLWEECRAAHPDGYSLSHFCDLYRNWEGRLAPTMRQAHVHNAYRFELSGVSMRKRQAAKYHAET